MGLDVNDLLREGRLTGDLEDLCEPMGHPGGSARGEEASADGPRAEAGPRVGAEPDIDAMLNAIPADAPPATLAQALGPVFGAVSTLTPVEQDVYVQRINTRFKGLSKPTIRAQIKQAVRKRASQLEGGDRVTKAGGVAQTRPQILGNRRQLRDIINDAWAALAGQTPPAVYRHGSALAVLAHRGPAELPAIELMTETRLFGLLARQADWFSVTTVGETTAAPPPHDVSRDMLALPPPTVPVLDSVIGCPVFDASGRLVDQDGYDARAGIWLERPPGFVVPPTSATPTQAEVAAARDLLLRDLLGDFPFVGPSDVAHVLALLLQPFARLLIGMEPTPLFLVRAPTPGTGKSLLVQVLSLLLIGTGVEAQTLPDTEEEVRKRITAELATGRPLVLFDNASMWRMLDSAALASVLTTTRWTDRQLGQTRMLSLPNLATWIVTANNPRVSAEIARRTVPIRLDGQVERPWQRDGFRHPDLLGWVREHRGELVQAAVTLIQNWVVRGRLADASVKPLGSFERWTSVMGGILSAAGIPRFLADLDLLYEAADAETEAWQEFVLTWNRDLGPSPVPVRELTDLCVREDLMTAVIGDGNEKSQQSRLGKALHGARGRVICGLKIHFDKDSHTKRPTYWVEPAPSDAGPAGGDGGPDCGRSAQRAASVPQDVPQGGIDAPAETTPASAAPAALAAPSAAHAHVGDVVAGDAARPQVHDTLGNGGGVPQVPQAAKDQPSKADTGVRHVRGTSAEPAAGNVYVATEPRVIPSRVVVHLTAEALANVAEAVSRADLVAVDLETTGLDPILNRPRLLQLGFPTGEVHVIDLFAVPDLGPLAAALRGATILGHNVEFDLSFLVRHLGVAPTRCFDTQLGSLVLDGGAHLREKGYHRLESVSSRMIGAKLDKRLQNSDWSGALSTEQITYAATDSAVLFPTWNALRAALQAEGLLQAAELEFSVAPAVAAMGLRGIGVNRAGWEELVARRTADAARLGQELAAVLGVANVRSNSQVLAALRRRLGPGVRSTGAEALAPHQEDAAVRTLSAYRSASSFRDTVGRGFLAALDRHGDGRVRGAIHQLAAPTGRMSCSGPNLMGVPKADAAVRGCVTPPDGMAMIVADYAAIELRVLASVTKEARLLQVFASPSGDPHRATASMLLRKPPEEITSEERARAKPINFGFAFGMGADRFVAYARKNYGVEFSRQEAQRFKSAYLSGYRGVDQWQREVRRRMDLGTRSASGRIRRFEDRREGYTDRLNMPIQGTAADGMKAALARLHRRLPELGAHLVLVVHDEVLVEAPITHAREVKAAVEAEMIAGMAEFVPDVPIVVEAEVRRSWAKGAR